MNSRIASSKLLLRLCLSSSPRRSTAAVLLHRPSSTTLKRFDRQAAASWRSSPPRLLSTLSAATRKVSTVQHVAPHAMLHLEEKVPAPPMVYISGEEMTNYACQLMVEKWFTPYFDITAWQTFDLSCKNRDKTSDQVLHDAVKAGSTIGAIFKEPTITPSAVQVQEMKLKKPLGSPNGAMRRGWNGITISRDTIHIEGIDLGYKNPVFFERHAVGGEYGAGWSSVGQGTLLTTYLPKDANAPPFVVDKRDLTDDANVVVVYHNPYDNVAALAHLFFKRCLEANITPYVVTKKTVFKWQEAFWATMKSIFDKDYKVDFKKKGLLDKCGGELTHLISDAATMQLIRWTDGGFGMAAHNYDGDMRKYWGSLRVRVCVLACSSRIQWS
jgi:isocitrate dehydrogenase